MTTLTPEPKTTHPTSSPLPATIADLAPADADPGRTGCRGRQRPEATDASRTAGTPRRARHQVVQRRPAQAPGPRDRRRLAPPGARHDPGDPRRQRLRQVDPHPPRLGVADPGRGPGRGLRLRHRTRRARREAAHQPGVGRCRVLQEAQPDGEPPLRRPPVRPRWPAQAKREATAILGRLGIAEKPARPPGGADEPGDAAEGRDRASPADEPDAAPARRADHRPRPAQQARRPGVHRGGQRRRTARRSSSRRTTWPRRSASASGSRSSTGVGSSPRTRPRGSSDSSPSGTGSRRRSSRCS